MDLETRKKISRTMKGHSNFEGHKHTHATKIQIAISQEGHKNAKDHKWAVDKETGKETRIKGGKNLPKGNRWGRTRSFSQWIHAKEETEVKDIDQQTTEDAVELNTSLHADRIIQMVQQDKANREQVCPKPEIASFAKFKDFKTS